MILPMNFVSPLSLQVLTVVGLVKVVVVGIAPSRAR